MIVKTTINREIISNEGEGADITNHVLTSMRHLKLKPPVIRAYIHTPLSCWSAYLSVYTSGMELPLNVSKMSLPFFEASFSISYHVLVVIYPAFLCV